MGWLLINPQKVLPLSAVSDTWNSVCFSFTQLALFRRAHLITRPYDNGLVLRDERGSLLCLWWVRNFFFWSANNAFKTYSSSVFVLQRESRMSDSAARQAASSVSKAAPSLAEDVNLVCFNINDHQFAQIIYLIIQQKARSCLAERPPPLCVCVAVWWIFSQILHSSRRVSCQRLIESTSCTDALVTYRFISLNMSPGKILTRYSRRVCVMCSPFFFFFFFLVVVRMQQSTGPSRQPLDGSPWNINNLHSYKIAPAQDFHRLFFMFPSGRIEN